MTDDEFAAALVGLIEDGLVELTHVDDVPVNDTFRVEFTAEGARVALERAAARGEVEGV